MQEGVVELIRTLMHAQQLSVRKVSARIAEVHGGSDFGYTQQISRILNDPDYDPSFATVQKILSALNLSVWEIPRSDASLKTLEAQVSQLTQDVGHMRAQLAALEGAIAALAAQQGSLSAPSPPSLGETGESAPPGRTERSPE